MFMCKYAICFDLKCFLHEPFGAPVFDVVVERSSEAPQAAFCCMIVITLSTSNVNRPWTLDTKNSSTSDLRMVQINACLQIPASFCAQKSVSGNIESSPCIQETLLSSQDRQHTLTLNASKLP